MKDSLSLEVSSVILHHKKRNIHPQKLGTKIAKQKDPLATAYQNKIYLPYLQKIPTPRLIKKGGKQAGNVSKKVAVKSIVDSIVFKF